MIRPRRPKDETRRLATLRHSPVVVGALNPTLDEITRAASELFQTGLGALGLVEEQHQFFAAGSDLPAETRRDDSFCAHAIAGREVLAVADASRDRRFSDSPLVTGDAHVRFYAGCPVSARNGSLLGALCVLGREPRAPGAAEFDALRDLGLALEREIQSFEAASFDALTGLTNRAGLFALGEEMLSISRSAEEGAAVLYVGAEGIADVNARFGHAAGDRALRDLARILEGNVRSSDLVARVGGDEFCVVLTPYTADSERIPVAARVERAVERYNETADVPWTLQVNLGGARYRPGMALDRLVALADSDMAEARVQRRARHH